MAYGFSISVYTVLFGLVGRVFLYVFSIRSRQFRRALEGVIEPVLNGNERYFKTALNIAYEQLEMQTSG